MIGQGVVVHITNVCYIYNSCVTGILSVLVSTSLGGAGVIRCDMSAVLQMMTF